MGLEKIKGAFEDLVEKQNSFPLKCDLVVNQIKYELEHALSKLQSDQGPAVNIESILGGLKRGVGLIEREKKLQTAHEELESTFSKCLEVLEEELDIDLNDNDTIDFEVQTTNRIVADHFLLRGMFEIGDCFIIEAGATKDDTLRAQFFELYEILEPLRTGDFQLAQNWITSNREKLREISSSLEVMLHQVRFIEYLKQGSRTDALEFVRANLTPLVSSHQHEVHRSMVWLLYMGNLENCPDSQCAQANWGSFSDKLARQFCILLGRSCRSPLAVTVEAGAEALLAPSRWLERLAELRRTGQKIRIPSKSSVELSDAFQFHSVFVCPARHKEASNANPPMRLPCGHVYSNEFVLMMSEVHEGTRIMCPRCQRFCDVSKCKRLHL